jgi:hypothetical protein
VLHLRRISEFPALFQTSVDEEWAHTELVVLSRNPNVDALTREALAYDETALRTKQFEIGKLKDVNFGLICG